MKHYLDFKGTSREPRLRTLNPELATPSASVELWEAILSFQNALVDKQNGSHVASKVPSSKVYTKENVSPYTHAFRGSSYSQPLNC